MAGFERGAYEPPDDVRVFDASDDELEDEGSRLPLLIVIGLLVFAAFAGVVWLAYTQGVARGRQDAPRMIVAETGPVKVAPTNAGGAQSPYAGLKIYQQPAPPDDANDDQATAPPTPAGSAGQQSDGPAVSPSLAPVIRPDSSEAAQKTATSPSQAQTAATTHAPAKTVVASAPPAPKATTPAIANPKPVATPKAKVAAAATPATAPSASRVATKPPAVLSPSVTKTMTETSSASAETGTAPSTQVPTVTVATPPAEKHVASTGAFVLQIGSYKSEDEANAAWKAYQRKHPLVGGYEPNIKKVDLGDKGTWYRLRVGGFSDKDEAGTFCGKLKTDGGDCIPSKE